MKPRKCDGVSVSGCLLNTFLWSCFKYGCPTRRVGERKKEWMEGWMDTNIFSISICVSNMHLISPTLHLCVSVLDGNIVKS